MKEALRELEENKRYLLACIEDGKITREYGLQKIIEAQEIFISIHCIPKVHRNFIYNGILEAER